MFPKSFKIGKVVDIQNILKNHINKHYGKIDDNINYIQIQSVLMTHYLHS